jgi:hypothetical protein
MNRILFGLLSSSLILGLCACSGPPKTVPPPPGNATLSLTLRATPPLPSARLSILTFRATVTGVSLTPSSGSAVSVNLVSGTAASYVAEFTRLQSDSALLSAAVSIPAGTYNSLAVTFSDVLLTFCTQPSSGVAGCSSGSLGQVTGSAGAATTTSSGAFPLTVTSGEKVGLALDVNIANAITASGQTISAANLAAPNVLTATVLQAPSSTTDLSSGQLAHIDDLYGVVSNVSASAQSFTLQTAYRGAVSITANSSTTYDPVCSTQDFSCVTSGALAAVDAILNADGTLAVRNYSPVPFTAASKDTLEGVVYTLPSSINQVFDIVVTDASFASSNSPLNGSVHPGDLVTVGVVTPQPFFVVSEGLTIPTNSFSSSTDVSPIQPGQTVAISLSGFVAANGRSAFATATANGVALRFSRVTGNVVNPTSPQFSATSFPPYFGFSTNALVEITTTGPGTTTDFDGTSSFTEVAGDTVSISALYFGSTTSPSPPAWSFSAATIRRH